MRGLPLSTLFGAACLALGSFAEADASVVVAGLEFEGNAFADVLLASGGEFTVAGAATLADAVTGSNLESYAFSFSPGAFLEVGFTGIFVANGPGADLALFELGQPDTFSVTINGVTQDFLTTFTGFTAGDFDVNVALVNLTDFGLAAGAKISSFLIGMDRVSASSTLPSLAVVGALNTAPIPLPASLPLLTAGLGGLVLLRRRRLT